MSLAMNFYTLNIKILSRSTNIYKWGMTAIGFPLCGECLYLMISMKWYPVHGLVISGLLMFLINKYILSLTTLSMKSCIIGCVQIKKTTESGDCFYSNKRDLYVKKKVPSIRLQYSQNCIKWLAKIIQGSKILLQHWFHLSRENI